MKKNQAPSLFVALLAWVFSIASINTSAERPSIGVTYDQIDYQSQSSALTHESTVRCCPRSHNLMIMCEHLESCDVCILHDVTLNHNRKHRIGGAM